MFDTSGSTRPSGGQVAVDDERGMVTSEYAVGTAGAFCIGCVLFKLGILGADDWLADIFKQIGTLGQIGIVQLREHLQPGPRL